jgi:hypothetical protein
MTGRYRRCTGRCGGVNWATLTHRWCKPCQNASRARTRTPYRDMPEEARARHRARATAKKALVSGRLTPTPCPCGCATLLLLLEMHHEDYSLPLDVVFVCHREHRRRDAARLERLRATVASPERVKREVAGAAAA